MRKQNSTFQTAFLSEAGNELENNDYFAYVELDKYACYVIADGLNEQPDEESARLAIETILLAFQERPSIRKSAVMSYMKAANRQLYRADAKNRLKASIIVVVSDYTHIRYGYAGNTRLRLYRDGNVYEKSVDMSLGREMTGKKSMTDDALARHEERNNLYTWLGQEKGFHPHISKKIKLTDGDILTLYTRGIWENLDEGELKDVFAEAKDDPQECIDNVEDMLLSKQPENLENYTFVTIFADKVFTDPNKKRRIRKVILISVIVLVVMLIAAFVIWLVHRQRVKQMEEMEQSFAETIEYMEDNNYIRAGEECEAALETAKKLRDKEKIEEISDYMKLIEAVNKADELYDKQEYEQAQSDYMVAKERSRYADHIADEYIEIRLDVITDYISIYDYIQLGDSLSVKGDYTRAEEKYLEAKRLATDIYFSEGRQEAMDALDRLYEELALEEEAENAKRQEQVTAQTGAAELISKGDKVFEEGDYEGAKVYYAMALDKYQKLEDDANVALTEIKLQSCVKKATQKDEKKEIAEGYIAEAKQLEEEGNLAEAKKKYLLAKAIYEEMNEDAEISRMENLMDMLEVDREEAQDKSEAEGKNGENAQNGGETVSGNSVG